jgi:hypothetical protein
MKIERLNLRIFLERRECILIAFFLLKEIHVRGKVKVYNFV